LDYLQRSGLLLPELSADTSLTHATGSSRRLWHITEIGRISKRLPLRQEVEVRLPSEDLLVGLYGHKIPMAFLVQGTTAGAAVHWGTWSPDRGPISKETIDERQRILKAALDALYPEVKVVPATVAMADFPLAGMALGIPTAVPTDPDDGAAALDRLIRAMAGTNWACLILAEPVEEGATSRLRGNVIEEMRRVQLAAESGQAPPALLKHYLEILEVALQNLTGGLSVGAWRVGVYLLGDSTSYYRLSSLWRGIFSGDQSLPEPVRVWKMKGAAQLAARWALPDMEAERGPGHFRHPLAYQTILTSDQLAACAHLPQVETNGFAISAVPDFDVVPPPVMDQDAVTLGQVVLRRRPVQETYAIRRRDLTRHVFVAGVTGAGKSNTIFYLLKQAGRAGVPFLVIEPAKTEYRSLLDDPELASPLQVFTPANERVSPFRLNPFEVLPGTPVSTHIDLLRSVFAASFGMWTPLPQVLERCLHAIYQDKGWDVASDRNSRLDDRADRASAFPTLTDLAAKVEEVTVQLGYEDRVTADIRAALLTRIEGLRTGGKGRMLDVRCSLPMSLLMEQPTVLELEGMGDDDDKAFMMGLLLIRLVEFRRAVGPTGELRHLLVVEEAHRLLANVGMHSRPEDANPRGKAVETFANLLSEIRAYGQGVVIADQVPVKLAPDVIKNTNLKFAHRTVAADDRITLAGAMAMNERQTEALATLPRGQAAVFSEGDDAPILVQVPLARQQAGAIPTDEQVARHMGGLPALQTSSSLFLPLAACAETCAGNKQACRTARQIVGVHTFQRNFARLVQSVLEDASALDRLWPELVALVRARRSRLMEESELLPALSTHAADWYAEHRGAQASWTFSETEQLATHLRQLLLAHVGGRDKDEVQDTFRQTAHKLLARPFDPFPACSRICPQQPPVCLYRYVVADLIASGEFGGAWPIAERADAQNPEGGRWQTLALCADAASELIELAGPEWLAEAAQAADAAGRRAALCFAQQMLANHPGKSPLRRRQIMDLLIKEANHG
jgi:hypothetical protein